MIDFFDKKTKMHEQERIMDFPDDLIFAAAAADEFTGDELANATKAGKQIDYINCRPFALSGAMQAYAVEKDPALKEKFEKYLHEFIGRQGLGPEYF